jgi:hypothetical protein
MNEEHKQLEKAVEANCILLNDALEIHLRRLHNEKEVMIDNQCIELVLATIEYTEMYLTLKQFSD